MISSSALSSCVFISHPCFGFSKITKSPACYPFCFYFPVLHYAISYSASFSSTSQVWLSQAPNYSSLGLFLEVLRLTLTTCHLEIQPGLTFIPLSIAASLPHCIFWVLILSFLLPLLSFSLCISDELYFLNDYYFYTCNPILCCQATSTLKKKSTLIPPSWYLFKNVQSLTHVTKRAIYI